VSIESNWWQNFFEGVAVDMWLRAVPADHTEREAESVVRLLDVPLGAAILDVPCGGGRLSMALARRGYSVTGVDWSLEFLNHARSGDGDRRVTWEQRDMRDLPWRGQFDGAFCLGNSFGYLDDAGNVAFLQAVAAALKPGARFVLETPMVLENMLEHVKDRAWWKVGNIYLLVSNRYDQAQQRLEIEYTFVSNGRIDVRSGSHRAYTYRELVQLIEAAGFAVATEAPWRKDATTVSFIATRR
jgi:2-polyprenyl-3-methyl-5-hydroxy-6-metoxy-1,4-benzoquinol methylase